MQFSVVHRTTYLFSQPVFLEPHTLRLMPRADGTHQLVSYESQIVPEPTGRSEFLDPEGNALTRIWFSDLLSSLDITVRTTVRNKIVNPFDFLLDESAEHLPLIYANDIEPHLAPYIRRQPPSHDPVGKFAKGLLQESNHDTLPFLILLTARVYEQCKTVIREEGDPFAAEVTLAGKEGSCRDLAVLCMDACRAVGLAARFVSGYQPGDPDNPERHLHAWLEVYLPLAGWRGLDPTHGLMVANQHIPLAAAALSKNAAPVTGNFRGTGATAEMQTSLSVERID